MKVRVAHLIGGLALMAVGTALETSSYIPGLNIAQAWGNGILGALIGLAGFWLVILSFMPAKADTRDTPSDGAENQS